MNLYQDSLANNTAKWQQMQQAMIAATIKPCNTPSSFRRLVGIRWCAENLLMLLFQYSGFMLQDGLAKQTFAPVWFATGTACAFIFMRGPSIIPGLWMGSFLGLLQAQGLTNAILCASILTGQACLILWLCYRFIGPTLIFYSRAAWWRFILICALLTAITSLSIASNLFDWLHRWMGNLSGILVFALAILTWDVYFLELAQVKKNKQYRLIFVLFFLNILCLMVDQSLPWILGLSFTALAFIWYFSRVFFWNSVVAASFVFGLCLNFSVYFPALANPNTLLAKQFVLLVSMITGLTLCLKEKKTI